MRLDRGFYEGTGTGFMGGMDARVKLAFCAGCLAVILLSPSSAASFYAGISCLAFLLVSGVPMRHVALRMGGPLVFSLFVAIFQAAFTGGTPAFSMALGPVSFSLGKAGLLLGAGIILHVFGAVAVVLFLSMTTPAHRLLSAAAWYRLPRGLVELLMLTYRYVFVIFEDAVTLYHSQRGRLGYSSVRIGVRSLGTLCGAVFLKALSQAESTGRSMSLRGYTGEYVPACRERFQPSGAILLSLNFSVTLGILLWTR